ncbi:DNA cytosine methyltransferase [Bartonella apihabitans]|uniref:DNA cytosine methyltransferase n=1 Tax=Bartonella apihabitans TaxID=2750929 RepID=UPI0018DB5D79|nr:DNA cytosine methyltransferase [Bartonella apihabitans]
MIYGSICSGIEAATVAWAPLGWQPAFFSEIEKFPCQLLAHRYGSNMPNEPICANGVPNFGDMNGYEQWPQHSIDILVGGTPCQDFSIAGLRAGLAGERSSLVIVFAHIIRKYRPRWFVWENVPGVLTSGDGQDFADILGLFTGRRVEKPENGWRNAGYVAGYKNAYSVAWRVIDAQYTRVDGFPRAVPQRRRRVFLVGHSGTNKYPASVLFDRESLRGNSAPCRETRASIATSIADGAGTSGEEQPLLTAPVASTLNANYGTKYGQDNQHVDAGCPLFVCTLGHSQSNGLGVSNANVANTLEATASVNQAVFDRQSSGEYSANDVASTVSARDYKSPSDLIACSPIAFDCLAGGKTGNATGDIPGALHGVGRAAIATKTQVRRLMPIECERLMGFPDNYTKLDEKTADAPRYKALGNSMAVNCMRWVGERIQLVENFLSEKLEAAE